MRKIPSLDGLRAVSIALVLIGHICNGLDLAHNYAFAIIANAGLGVTVFFVISGYLITSLLLKEFDSKGSISYKHFYIRRAFRILPPYYFYFLAICIAAMMGYLPVSRTQATSAFVFI
jgi:peptidoglycan/LPS O-acetylase OafA/YrhL